MGLRRSTWMAEDHSALDDVLAARRSVNAAAASELAFMDDYVRGRTACASPWDSRVTEKDLYSSAICELAAALSSTFATVHNKVRMWRALRPLVKRRFVDGSLDMDRARTIHDHLLHARPETVVGIEAEILKAAAEMAPATLGREIDRLLTEADPVWDREVRIRAARTEKRIRLRRRARGLSSLTATMTDEEAAEQVARIAGEVAGLHADDPRSLEQRRGDAHTALMRGDTLACLRPACSPAREHVALDTSTQETLSDGEPAPPEPSTARASQPASASASASQDQVPPDIPTIKRPGGGTLIERWRANVEADPRAVHALHPDGHGGMSLPPPGALTYKPGRALAARIRAEQPYCLHPGCNVPSEHCDLDHLVEFDHRQPERGGWTILSNVGPRCRLHHNLKTRKLWRAELLPEGVVHTVDPLGNHYFTAPTL